MRRSVTKSPGNYFIVNAFYKEIRKHQLQVQTARNSRRDGGARRQTRGSARPKQLRKSRFARKQPRSKAASRAARRSQGIGAAPSRSGGRGLAQDQSEEGQEFDKRRSSRIDGAETQSGRGRLTRRPARRGGGRLPGGRSLSLLLRPSHAGGEDTRPASRQHATHSGPRGTLNMDNRRTSRCPSRERNCEFQARAASVGCGGR